ncbi:MAG TPA: tetratricopeptide repeat protein [Tepidiformaceae bacterium]|nr:tetratricopeptide repeat protein [Tepidiformaceae bacterium]
MKRLLALAIFMAGLGAVSALVVLRILSRPRVAPAPYGPEVPLPRQEAPDETPVADLPEDVRLAEEAAPPEPSTPADQLTAPPAEEPSPGMLTESEVVLPEEVLTEERDTGMPAPLGSVAEPMGRLETEFPPAEQRLNGTAIGIEDTLPPPPPLADATDEAPSQVMPPPVSEVTGEPAPAPLELEDLEPSDVPPPPVTEVTGESPELVIEAEESLPAALIDSLAPTDDEPRGAAQTSDVLTSYFEKLAAEPVAEPSSAPSETPAPFTEAEVLPESVEEALSSLPGREITTAGQRDAESYLDEGNVYFNVGQYGLAIERYGKALELAPDLTAAYYNRANARTRAGDYDAALEDYNQALALQPGDADTLNNRGMLHLYRANYAEALQDFNAALSLDPTDTTVMVNRGLAHLHGGEAGAALVDFQEAASLDTKDAAAHYGAGQAAAVLENRDESLRHLGRALELDPGYAREAASDPKLASLQGDSDFLRLLRESGSRAER